MNPAEAPPQTPVIGSRSTLAISVHPTFLIWRRPGAGGEPDLRGFDERRTYRL